MWKGLASNGFTILIVAIFLMIGGIMWGKTQFDAQGPLDRTVCFKVGRGANIDDVSENLVELGAVDNGMIFRLGAQYTERANKLKAGSYLIPPQSSMRDVVGLLTKGGASNCGTEIVYLVGVAKTEIRLRELDPQTNKLVVREEFTPGVDPEPDLYKVAAKDRNTRVRIQVIEGTTAWQVAEAIKSVDMLDGTIAEIPYEGSLFPDTYDLIQGTDRNEIIRDMQIRQRNALETAWKNRSADLPIKTPDEALILASIIEKETGVPEERGKVASVFVNRLAEGMKLQTDPTVIYGVTKGQGVLGRGLKQSELRKETPWNTYVIEGLPPTPIANPSQASIEAALNPEKTDYLFFVADGTGGHAFATTLVEHNANVAKWRKIESERAKQ